MSMTAESKIVAVETPSLIAPLWHTILLIAISLGISIFSARMLGGGPANAVASNSKTPLYISIFVCEWALFYFVVAGVRGTGTRLQDLIGRPWSNPRDIAIDLLTAALFFVVANGFLQIFKAALYSGSRSENAAAAVLPHRTDEFIAFALLSITAGICEEVVFRGYLQKQFLAISKSASIAILAQAMVFGFSHGYQGLRSMVTISAYAILFGLLAHWRRTLMPGIVAHAWQDIFSGIISR
jgi:membrane protease YdiL (CAAX protease family)